MLELDDSFGGKGESHLFEKLFNLIYFFVKYVVLIKVH